MCAYVSCAALLPHVIAFAGAATALESKFYSWLGNQAAAAAAAAAVAAVAGCCGDRKLNI
jgi:hypothetical protein